MNKIKYLIIAIFSFFIIFNVNAEDIKSIKIDINVDNNGTAHVTENWQVYIGKNDDLTEMYKPYYNYGNSEFKNFKVSLNNKEYTFEEFWDIDESFSYKKYKNGFNDGDNGALELCWGISEKGATNNYVISYDITNFVAGLNDADMVYWNLVPKNLSDEPENVYIKIYSDFRYSDTLDVWGYGKYGAPCYVYDGYIEMSSEEVLESDEYMTVLVKYPKGTFNTNNNILDNSFDYYLDMAEDGATSFDEEKASFIDFIFEIFPVIIFVVVAIFASFKTSKITVTGNKKIKFLKGTKKLPKEVNYFRDIPCNKDIYFAYWISKTYKLNKNDADILGAILLKWLNEGKIEIQKIAKEGIFKKEESKIILKPNLTFDLYLEQELYSMIFEASIDGILEAKEFKRWANDNYTEVFSWFKRVLDYYTEEISKTGLLNKLSNYKYETTTEIYNHGVILKGFKKFLLDFSRIHEKNPIEVNLWKEYLMMAQILGLATKVAKEFKDIYPDMIPDEYISDLDFVYFVSYTGINSASTAKSRAESYNSGGGGFSSGGGGMGSFGGGFGGGGAR